VTQTDGPSSGRLVIVEDEGILALDLERHLTGAGFDVRGVAADSDSALALVAAEHPDLVLMDIRLHGTRDGIDTATELRLRFDVPVVYLTAHSDPKTMARAQLTEPMGYLLKPFKKPDLQNVVTIALARHEAERKLRRREEALSVTLSCIGEAIVTTDEEGRVTYLNVAAEKLAGRPVADSMQRPLSEVVSLTTPEGGPLHEDPVQAAQARGRMEFESRLGLRSLAGTAAELREGDRSFGVVLALRDLTELLLARRQLEFAERLSSLGTLAAGVAHEVNNPLSVVLSNLEYVLESPLSGEALTALTEARVAAQRVAQIVGDLRSLAQPQTELLRVLDASEALSSALSFTRGQWRTTAGVVLDLKTMPQILGSPTRLAQVFVNLIINAVHAMQQLPGRTHELTLATATSEHGDAVLSVTDTGGGIPEALRERIFEPFFTTKPRGQGSGLGLAVSRSIVKNQGGSLELAASAPGAGASFTVTLPPARPGPSGAQLKAWWVGPPSADSEALQREGCRVLSGEEPGLERLLASDAPEVVLVALPDAEAKRLRAQLPELESRSFRVAAEGSTAGAVTLRPGFDVHALTAFVRR